MRFYTQQHQYYCGIDLHARAMYLCILDQQGNVLLHRNLPAKPEQFLKAVAPYREDIVVSVECMFAWYWVADLCAKENIPFVLGHALFGAGTFCNQHVEIKSELKPLDGHRSIWSELSFA